MTSALPPEQQQQQQDVASRLQRKLEGKQRKRQRIEDSGGIRPRGGNDPTSSNNHKNGNTTASASTVTPSAAAAVSTVVRGRDDDDNSVRNKVKGGSPFLQQQEQRHNKNGQAGGGSGREPRQGKNRDEFHNSKFNNKHGNDRKKSTQQQQHRFGRVMEQVPCRNQPRYSTLSIALPGSVLANCQTKELRTLLVGQIARAATIYHVDEIVVFDDKLGNKQSSWRDFKRGRRQQQQQQQSDDKNPNNNNGSEPEEATPQHQDDQEKPRFPKSTSEEFMARLLQYCECPQYLRRSFFPMHPDLQFAGLLAPIDAPHHVRADERSKYREGVVLDKTSSNGNHSLVNCGIRNRPVEIDRKIAPGIRCTVELDKSAYTKPGQIHGTVVSPSAPREDDGTYWGYTTRMASSIHDIFESCPYDAGYDLKIGTSERGDKSVEDAKFRVPAFEHSLIVFGGVAGIEECVDADESIKVPGSQSRSLFDVWLNVCPYQGSRTIRTEEAVMISLAKLSPVLMKSTRNKPLEDEEDNEEEDVEFSDAAPSEESSDDDNDDGGSVRDDE